MSSIVAQIENFIRDHGLIPERRAVLIAVSGGLDSVVLLRILHQLAGRHQWKLAVAHFNHQLRGRASEADHDFVQQTAEDLGLPFHSARGNVRQWAKDLKLSIEMAARQLRYQFLIQTATRLSLDRIALGHHADDQVELFFLRLLRGAGAVGLSGMKPLTHAPGVHRIQLVRPLLAVTRSDIQLWATTHHLAHREDASNRLLQYPRNRVRHQLLPWLKQHFQPALTPITLRTVELLSSQDDLVNQMAQRWMKSPKPGAFLRLPIAVQRSLIQAGLIAAGLNPTFDRIESLRVHPNTKMSAGPGLWVYLNDLGQVVPWKQRQISRSVEALPLVLRRQGEVEFGSIMLHWSIHRQNPTAALPSRQPKIEHFDADPIGKRVILRHWQPGDRFQPIGMPKPVKVQDLFVNNKIPRGKRHEIAMAQTENGVIFWIQGLRIGDAFKLTSQTRRRLEWSWTDQPDTRTSK
ncbi:MAG TPA: tRNA lysidine(34) synthetase TilS [Candidatus Paceibacterota bacterium]|nr:tRNA lysidine(34) synthetase TilS [Verrucomicrobiota bacterium]HRY51690.1 tRNA lysidine(34) synthetase TilS [Candidatus Paceibacterota bacterium]